MNFRVYTRALSCLLLTGLLSTTAPLSAATGSLLWLNWADYIDPALLRQFSTETGIEVRQVYYHSDEHRDRLLTVSAGSGYDLLLVSGLQLKNYVHRGWLAPLPKPLPQSIEDIEARWWKIFPTARDYAVPYFWGTLGVAWRRDLLPQGITSWRQVFEPERALIGRLQLPASGRELLGMALKSQGLSANSHDPRHFERAMALIRQQRPAVARYGYVELSRQSPLVTGEAVVAMMYNGDALALQQYSDQIAYALPREGGHIWVDYLAVSAHSKNKAAAWALIKFLNRPQVAAQLAEYVLYAPANPYAEQYLSDEFLANKTVFPDQKALAESEFFKPLPDSMSEQLQRQFQSLIDNELLESPPVDDAASQKKPPEGGFNRAGRN